MFGQSWKISSTCLTPLRAAPHRVGLSLAGLAVLAAAAAEPAWANPQGASVVAGTVTIDESAPGTLQVQQSSNAAIINWQSFDIGGTETTVFNMPSSSSVNLSRVVGNNLSEIDGKLESNGRLYLINPQGIVFGEGASVNVGGLVATTANINDQNFLAGRMTFDQASPLPGASIINNGQISIADTGLGALVAPEVQNSGVIEANLGQVVLGGAETFALDMAGDGLISFAVGDAVKTGPADGGAAVTNSGTIRANGGRVLLSAAVAAGVVDNAINMSGVVEARSVSVDSTGAITLDGGGSGVVEVSGRLDASGTAAGQSGGAVKVTGDLVRVKTGAEIDASGAAGGGVVLVGGDAQGSDGTPTARRTVVEHGASLTADATAKGEGGTVVIWGDEAAAFNGAASVRGGAQGGNGGLVEVSSNGSVGIATGTVDAGAPKGKSGKLVIDPRNITIRAGGVDDTNVLFADTPTDLVVNPGAIAAAAAGSTVVFQAEVDINVDSAVTSNAHLVMQAGDDIFVNDEITMGAGANLHLEAGSLHADEPIDGFVFFDDPSECTSCTPGGIEMDGGTLTMIASDFTGRDLGNAIGTGEGGRVINLSFHGGEGGIVVGGASGDVTSDELAGLGAGTKFVNTVNIGQATTAGTDGLGEDAREVIVSTIDIGGTIDTQARLGLFSNFGFTDDGFSISATTLDIDASGQFGGTVVFRSDASATTTGDMSITGADVSLVAEKGDEIRLSAGSDIVVKAQTDVRTTALNGGAITLDATGDVSLSAGNDISVRADVGSSVGISGASVDVTANKGLDGGISLHADADGDITFAARDEISFVGTDIQMTGQDGGSIELGGRGEGAPPDIRMTSESNIDLNAPDGDISISGGAVVALGADGEVDATSTEDGNIRIASHGATSLAAGTELSLASGSRGVTEVLGDLSVGLKAGGDIVLTSTSDGSTEVRAGDLECCGAGTTTLSAGGDIRLRSDSIPDFEGPGSLIRSSVLVFGADSTVLNAGEGISSAALGDGRSVIVGRRDLSMTAAQGIAFTAGSESTVAVAGLGDVSLDAGKSISALATGEDGQVLFLGDRLWLSADGDITLRGLSPGGDLVPGNVELRGETELALQAGGDVSVAAKLLTSGGSMFLEADSADATNGGNGSGTLTLDAGTIVDTAFVEPESDPVADGDLTLIAADFDLDSAAEFKLGAGNLSIAPSTETLFKFGGVGSALGGAEISLLNATGQWSLGAALTAPGADGKQSLIVADTIDFGGDVTIDKAAALLLASTGDIKSNGFGLTTQQLSVRAGGNVDLTVDAGLLEVTTGADHAANDLDAKIISDQDVTVDDVNITLAVDDALNTHNDVPESAPGITAENLLIDADGSVTFNVAQDVPGKHVIVSKAAITFNDSVSGASKDSELLVQSAGDVEFNAAVRGLQLLWVDAGPEGDVTLAGGGSGLKNVVIGDLSSNVDEVVDLLDQGKLRDASNLVGNSGDDVFFGGTLAAENLLLKPNGDSIGDGAILSVKRLLVSGASAELFGSIDGVVGPLAALFGISEPIAPSTPKDFTFNDCVIGTNCTSYDPAGPKEPHVPPVDGATPPQAGEPVLEVPDLLVTKQRIVKDLEGRFSNNGNEEIW